MSTPTHRADVPVKERPRLQPSPRHRANRLLDRLGAQVLDLEELLHIARRDQAPEWLR